MKTLFITGGDLRHKYIVYKFSRFFKNYKCIIEKRDLNIKHKILSKNKSYKRHIENFNFYKRKNFEKYKNKFDKKKIIKTIYRNRTNNKIFNKIVRKIIYNYKPDLIFSYGCQILEIKKISKKIMGYNIHGGLLPFYRGVNTNFWPHYNKDSSKVGVSLHKIENRVDSGVVYFTIRPIIKKNSTINSLSCDAIKKFGSIVPKKFYLITKNKKKLKGKVFKKIYKSWRKKDFSPSMIDIANTNFKNYKKKFLRS